MPALIFIILIFLFPSHLHADTSDGKLRALLIGITEYDTGPFKSLKQGKTSILKAVPEMIKAILEIGAKTGHLYRGSQKEPSIIIDAYTDYEFDEGSKIEFTTIPEKYKGVSFNHHRLKTSTDAETDQNPGIITTALSKMFTGSKVGDSNFFYYTGHGFSSSTTGTLHLTLPKAPDTLNTHYHVLLNAVIGYINNIPGDNFIFIDACRTKDILTITNDPFVLKNTSTNATIILPAQQGLPGYIDEKSNMGKLTKTLTAGLMGMADINSQSADGNLSVSELWKFIHDEFEGNEQQPDISIHPKHTDPLSYYIYMSQLQNIKLV